MVVHIASQAPHRRRQAWPLSAASSGSTHFRSSSLYPGSYRKLRSCSAYTRSHSVGEMWPTPVYTLGREVPLPSFPIGGLKKNAEIVIRGSQLL